MPGMHPATAVAASNAPSSIATTSPASAKSPATSGARPFSEPGTSRNTPRPSAAATLGITRPTLTSAGSASCRRVSVPLTRLQDALPADVKVGRVMPNVAAALGLGVFLLVPGSLNGRAPEVAGLFALAGEVVEMDEGAFDAATAVAGCMPGMLAYLVTAFAAAGRESGVPADVSVRLAVAGVHGAAALIAREGDPAAVTAAAATPGGMTAAGIEALEDHRVAAAVRAAIAAATR